jgi:hypothetical protein
VAPGLTICDRLRVLLPNDPVIVSIDWLKAPRAMALLDAVLPPDATVYPRKFDLLVVDEVHQCAPAGRGAYATDSQRTIALRKIRPS